MSEAALSLTSYTRSNPSLRYRELLQQYQQLHVEGEVKRGISAEHTFSGHSLFAQAPGIKALIDRTGARRLLDYGSGKGMQYLPFHLTNQFMPGMAQYPSIKDYWGVESITCYDPCFTPFSTLPVGQFDGVVCTDVMEHCPEEDLPWIIEEIFSYAKRFVYINVACFPAKKHLPNGENAHCTVKDVPWWQAMFAQVTPKFPGLLYDIRLGYLQPGPPKVVVEEVIGNI